MQKHTCSKWYFHLQSVSILYILSQKFPITKLKLWYIPFWRLLVHNQHGQFEKSSPGLVHLSLLLPAYSTYLRPVQRTPGFNSRHDLRSGKLFPSWLCFCVGHIRCLFHQITLGLPDRKTRSAFRFSEFTVSSPEVYINHLPGNSIKYEMSEMCLTDLNIFFQNLLIWAWRSHDSSRLLLYSCIYHRS